MAYTNWVSRERRELQQMKSAPATAIHDDTPAISAAQVLKGHSFSCDAEVLYFLSFRVVFTGCRKTRLRSALCQGTSLQAAEKCGFR